MKVRTLVIASHPIAGTMYIYHGSNILLKLFLEFTFLTRLVTRNVEYGTRYVPEPQKTLHVDFQCYVIF